MDRIRRLLSLSAVVVGALASVATSEVPTEVRRKGGERPAVSVEAGERAAPSLVLKVRVHPDLAVVVEIDAVDGSLGLAWTLAD